MQSCQSINSYAAELPKGYPVQGPVVPGVVQTPSLKQVAVFGGRGDLAVCIVELDAPSDNIYHFVGSVRGEKQTQQAEADSSAPYKSTASQKGGSPDSEFWLP